MRFSRYILFVVLLAFTYLLIFPALTMASSPVIRIDGELRNFSLGAQIVNNRTMVPIRFVVEDEALQGEVFWDASLRKVAMNCRGKYIEMFIGSNEAWVDGEKRFLDSPPYIFESRTFIPLRFLSENLGAMVNWDAQKSEVLINFKYQPRVFAYYYRSFAEYQENIDLFSDVAFRWFETNGRGEIFYEYQDRFAEALDLARNKGVKTHASVVLMGKDALHQLLSNSENRARLIANLLDVVKKDRYDGVNIDFELLDPGDAGNLTLFLQELKTSLGTDKELSVAVFARTGKEKWPVGYEYKKIGQIADSVVVMAYDYSYSTTAPGPVAPLWWVREVCSYMRSVIPQDKILLGLPTYGYDWGAGKNAATITAPKLEALEAKYGLQKDFDYPSMSPCYSYYDEEGKYHEIWLENEASLKEKLNLVQENRLGGVSFWRIGNGFADLYRLLEGWRGK